MIAVAALVLGTGVAGRANDTQLKSAIVGYWESPRHDYWFQAGGIVRMCPTTGPDPATTTESWTVKGGVLYWLGPNKILSLDSHKIVFRDQEGNTFTMRRVSRAEAEGR
jgi:hypothetical protein